MLVQSASSYVLDSGCPLTIATIDDVRTTRFTPPERAALSTRSAPSRAGLIRSSSCLGSTEGNGEATWRTKSQPATASGQPASRSRSAAAKESRSRPVAPARSSWLRTSSARAGLRRVARTEWPAARVCRMQCPPMNPDPPVTRTRTHIPSSLGGPDINGYYHNATYRPRVAATPRRRPPGARRSAARTG